MMKQADGAAIITPLLNRDLLVQLDEAFLVQK